MVCVQFDSLLIGFYSKRQKQKNTQHPKSGSKVFKVGSLKRLLSEASWIVMTLDSGEAAVNKGTRDKFKAIFNNLSALLYIKPWQICLGVVPSEGLKIEEDVCCKDCEDPGENKDWCQEFSI